MCAYRYHFFVSEDTPKLYKTFGISPGLFTYLLLAFSFFWIFWDM